MHILSSPITQRASRLPVTLFTFSLTLLGFGLYQSLSPTSVVSAQSATPVYAIIKDQSGQPTIQVTGQGAITTLPAIKQALPVTYQNYLVEQGNGIWLLNANLSIDAGAMLNLSPQHGVSELRLRSDGPALAENQANTPPAVQAASPNTEQGGEEIPFGDEAETFDKNIENQDTADQDTADQDTADQDTADQDIEIIAAASVKKFVYLRAFDGIIEIDGVKVYSWNNSAQRVDNNYKDGRAYILAKLASTLNIRNAEIGYLGSSQQESYGLSWRDQNDPAAPKVLRTRVTGEVINSDIHHNYYGVYTFQAINMIFRGNRFHHNIRYGFDPHDYSHHILVEGNEAYNNGAHGFIISRGCHNFIFRQNKSYANFDRSGNQAHGFMLDPGGTGVGKPQVPSTQNIVEENEAYDNEGSGIRLLMAVDNQIRNNRFHHNNSGVAIDIRSNNNSVTANQLMQNRSYGLQIMRNSTVNTATLNLMAENGADGINLQNNARQNVLEQNTVRNNLRFGISAQGSQSTQNRWSQNLIYANQRVGILLSGRANGNLAAPTLVTNTVNSLILQSKAGALLEIYSDLAVQDAIGRELPAQGQFYEGQITAGETGRATLTILGRWQGNRLTAVVIDNNNNASAFSLAMPVVGASSPLADTPPAATPVVSETPIPGNPTVPPTETPQPDATEPLINFPPSITPTLTVEPIDTPQPTATMTPSAADTPPVNSFNQTLYLPIAQDE